MSHSRWKIGIFLIVIAMLTGYLFMSSRYRKNIAISDDMFVALVYYIELNKGQFPRSKQDLLNSDFIEKLSETSFLVKSRPSSSFAVKVYSRPIEDIDDFKIKFGADLRKLSLRDDKVVNEEGEVLLIHSPLGIETSREYSQQLLIIYQDVSAVPPSEENDGP